jgi:hypothetical protein
MALRIGNFGRFRFIRVVVAGMRVMRKVVGAVVFGSLSVGPALADLRTHLGVLADGAMGQIQSPWTAGEQDGWFVLSNDQDEAEQTIIINAGPPPQQGRETSVNLTILPTDQTAAVGMFLDDRKQHSLCLLDVTGAGAADLFCVTNGEHQPIAQKAGVAKLDGSDVITMQETPGKAAFYVNGTFIGEVTNHPALDASLGLMFYDRGTFAVTSFIMSEGTSTGTESGSSGQADAELASIIGPLADIVVSKDIRAGWEVFTQDGWLVMENRTNPEDSFGYAAEVGQPDEGGRAASVYLALTAPEGTDWATMSQSSAGVIMQDGSGNNICTGEISGAGDAVMTCWDAQGAREIGRLPQVAKFDGNDVVSLVEWPGVAQFWANNQMIGEVQNHPSQNGEVGVIAYGTGSFWLAGYNIASLASGEETGTTTTASSGNGEGPLPMFDGDSARITGTYLGVLTGIFLHEFGHALIGELQLPSTGPEEDAVDIFSALRISSPQAIQGPDESGTQINMTMAKYAALQWYYSGMIAEQQGSEGVPWQDEHTADLKRFRNTFCVIYGSNPSLWSDLAQQVQLDERTLSRCHDEFTKQNRAWRSILAPYTRVSEWYPDGMMRPDEPGAVITAVFEPSSRQVGNMVKAIIGDSGTFQSYIDGLTQDFVLPRDVIVTFKDCGDLNAWYMPSDGTVTMCYDLIEYLVVMISDIEMGTSGGYPVDGSSSPVASNEATSGGAVPFASSTPAVAAGAFDELEDFGIPTTWSLFSAPYNGPTPVSNPAATIVTTEQLAQILQDQQASYMLVDTRGQGPTLPNALIEKEAARDGSLTDGFQDIVAEWLAGQTAGNGEMYLIFFGSGPADRSAYNAALRAGSIGQYPNVLWYRGGEEAWAANGLPLQEPAQ